MKNGYLCYLNVVTRRARYANHINVTFDKRYLDTTSCYYWNRLRDVFTKFKFLTSLVPSSRENIFVGKSPSVDNSSLLFIINYSKQ